MIKIEKKKGKCGNENVAARSGKTTEQEMTSSNIARHDRQTDSDEIFIVIKYTKYSFHSLATINWQSVNTDTLMDKTPTHALFTQHYISLAC